MLTCQFAQQSMLTTNRLVEGWVIAFVVRSSHKLKPLLKPNMNLELVFLPEEFYLIILVLVPWLILFLLQMTKMRAILEQENWTEIDVPDEYQAIVTSLFSLESSTNGPKNESACDMATSNSDASHVEEAKQSTLVQHTVQTEIGTSGEVAGQVNPSRSRGETINNNAEVEASVTQNNDSNVKDKERGRSSLRTLSYGGVGYHMVNWSVLMLTNLYFINPFTSWLVSMFSTLECYTYWSTWIF